MPLDAKSLPNIKYMIALSSSFIVAIEKVAIRSEDGRIGILYHHPPTKHWFWQPPMDESIFVGVQESSWEAPAHWINTLQRVRRTVSIFPHDPCPKEDISGPREKLSTCDFSYRGKWKCSEWMPGFPSHVGYWPGDPFLSHPTWYTEVIGMAECLEEAGSMATRAQNTSKGVDSTNSFVDSIRKPSHELLEMHHQQTAPPTPQLAHRHPSMLHMLHAPTSRWFPTQVPTEVSVSICRRFGSTYIKQVQLCRTGRRYTNLSISGHFPRENKLEALNT